MTMIGMPCEASLTRCSRCSRTAAPPPPPPQRTTCHARRYFSQAGQLTCFKLAIIDLISGRSTWSRMNPPSRCRYCRRGCSMASLQTRPAEIRPNAMDKEWGGTSAYSHTPSYKSIMCPLVCLAEPDAARHWLRGPHAMRNHSSRRQQSNTLWAGYQAQTLKKLND